MTGVGEDVGPPGSAHADSHAVAHRASGPPQEPAEDAPHEGHHAPDRGKIQLLVDEAVDNHYQDDSKEKQPELHRQHDGDAAAVGPQVP